MKVKRLTIEVDDAFATGLTMTAMGADAHELRSVAVLIDPNRENYVRIDDTGEFHKEWRKEERE